MTKQNSTQKVQSVKVHDELKGIRYGSDSSAAGIKKAIDVAVASVHKGRLDVQKAAVLILMHAEKYGDYTKANDLVNALGSSVNAAALVEWFVKFGGLTVDAEARCFAGWSGKDYIRAEFQKAKATPWWTLKQPNPWAGFDLNAELQRVLRAYKRAQDKAAESDEDAAKVQLAVDLDVAAQLKMLMEAA